MENSKLPPLCAHLHPDNGEPILIHRGVIGYFPAPPDLDPDEFNWEHCVSLPQREAMFSGSMFGWTCPASNPDIYSLDYVSGKFVPVLQRGPSLNRGTTQ